MSNLEIILITMVAIAGLSVLIQLACLVVLAIAANKAVKMGKQYADEFRVMAKPVLDSSREAIQHSKEVLEATKSVIARLEPKLDAAAHDMAEMARMAREETARLQVSADEIQDRVRRQAARVDSMTTSLLDTADHAGHFLNHAVSVPVRQVSGVMAAAKAIIETLRAPTPPRARTPRNAHVPDESGQFV